MKFYIFIVSLIAVCSQSCDIPFESRTVPVEEVQNIDVNYISEQAMLLELNNDSIIRDTIFSWRFSKKYFIPIKNNSFVQDSLSLEETIQLINENKFFGKIKLELTNISNDTIYIKIPEADFLTEKIGNDLAQDFLSTTTFMLTDFSGVNFVNFDFKASRVVKAGTFNKNTFYKYSILKSGGRLQLDLFEYNTLKPEIIEIEETEFRKISIGKTSLIENRYLAVSNIDSLRKVIEREDSLNEAKTELKLQELLKRFPKALSKSKHCLILNTVRGLWKICQDADSLNIQSWSSYRLEDYRDNYLVIYLSGYEWWNYCLYNLETRKQFEIEGKPVFVDGKYVFGINDYYDTGNFALYDLKNPERFFVFNSWTIVDGYRINKTFYLKLRSSRYMTFFQYFKIDFSEIL